VDRLCEGNEKGRFIGHRLLLEVRERRLRKGLSDTVGLKLWTEGGRSPWGTRVLHKRREDGSASQGVGSNYYVLARLESIRRRGRWEFSSGE